MLAKYEQELLEGVPHLSLTYEENIRDSENHQKTVDEICTFLGVSSTSVMSNYEKIAPPKLQDGVANYNELARRLKGTSYEKYLV